MDEDVTESAGTPPEPEKKSTDSTTPEDSEEAEAGTALRDDSADDEDSADITGTRTNGSAEQAGNAGQAGSAQQAETAEQAGNAEQAGSTQQADNDAEAGAPPRRNRRWLRWTAAAASVLLLGASGAGWWAYRTLDRNITTDTTAAAELHTYERERPTPVALDAQNILLIGSDSRAGKGNGKYGQDDGGSQRSDTTILLHLAADRKSATAMSIPRDLMVEIPSCRSADGSRTRAQFAQFNWAFQFGGAACTIRTIEKLTGIRVDHHIVIDFSGFEDTVDAVDGVEVCLKDPVDDEQARLKLPKGRQTLTGEQALGYVRARHGIGDGSDTQRMDRQQRFLGALFKKVQSDGVLLNPTRLYPVLDAVTRSITTDAGLNSLTDLYNLASSMRGVPVEKVQFLTVPRQPYALDPNRDELVESSARKLFERLRDDEPVTIDTETSPADTDTDTDADTVADTETYPASDAASPSASESAPESDSKSPSDKSSPAALPSSEAPSPSSTPAPTFTGSNAEAGMCG
ncbi:LCP family protein [Streptomyces sp. NPDC088124]|uniref:LCP family protein n=1 Tax=Streptomyces sp. NPDC088124 TaxID=3154654 RepID=UPI0034126181